MLYGDRTESSIASDSFRHALGTAIVSIFKNGKGKFAFRHPLDLRSWRVNAFGGFEVAAGTPIIKKASEYNTMHDFYELGVFAEFCLLHFGGVIPEQFSKLIEKLKRLCYYGRSMPRSNSSLVSCFSGCLPYCDAFDV